MVDCFVLRRINPFRVIKRRIKFRTIQFNITLAETKLHSLERFAAGIGLHVNALKTEYMCYNQTGDISTLDGTSLKLVDKFTYLGNSVSSTEKKKHRHAANKGMDSHR